VVEKKKELAKRLGEAEVSLNAQAKLKEEVHQLDRRCQHLQVRTLSFVP
jgi:hypothetical protein